MRGWMVIPALLSGIVPGVLRGAEGTATSFDFGAVRQGERVEHRFSLRNDGEKSMRITGVRLTPPLHLARMPASIPAGSVAELVLGLDTAKIEGKYEGLLEVKLDDGTASTRTFLLGGRIVPEIEVLPRPAFFLSTTRGNEKSGTLDIVNHGANPAPLTILTAPEDVRLTLEPVEAGRHYRLTATLAADAMPGRQSRRIELARGDDTRAPPLYIGLNTTVRERVYSFPDAVDFGRLDAQALLDSRIATQTLMVYGGQEFTVSASSDVPGLRLQVAPGPTGDRVQITATLSPGDTKSGRISGTILIATNDPELRALSVPVSGEIVGPRANDPP